MIEKETLTIAGNEVILDPDNLKFDEMTLTNYIQTEGGYYDNFGAYLALAEKVLHLREMEYDQVYTERFVEAKNNGGSDKLAEATSKSDVDVMDAKKHVVEAKYKVKRLQQHLRAWDRNHDNAQSLGHMIRKEMDKLNSDIMGRVSGLDMEKYMQDRKVENTITPVEQQVDEKKDDGPLGMETGTDIDDLRSLVG